MKSKADKRKEYSKRYYEKNKALIYKKIKMKKAKLKSLEKKKSKEAPSINIPLRGITGVEGIKIMATGAGGSGGSGVSVKPIYFTAGNIGENSGFGGGMSQGGAGGSDFRVNSNLPDGDRTFAEQLLRQPRDKVSELFSSTNKIHNSISFLEVRIESYYKRLRKFAVWICFLAMCMLIGSYLLHK